MAERCRICGALSEFAFTAKVMTKYDVQYFQCPECNFIQTEEPHWLEEAYSTPINVMDTGIMQRNISQSGLAASLICTFFDRRGRFVDHGGGYGIMTRMMRDLGLDYYWFDPYAENLMARGFEYEQGMKVELMTSFETFEHFSRPMDEIEKLFAISPNLLFSTDLLPEPLPRDWWYFGFEHGQHISFYSEEAMRRIAGRFGKRYHHLGSMHLLTDLDLNARKGQWVRRNYKRKVLPRVQKELHSRTMDDFELMRQRILDRDVAGR